MDKMRRRNPRKFRKDMQWDYLRMYPVTRKKLWICKAAEDNIDIADFIDLLVTEYIVRRGLQAAVAKVISNAEAAAQTREKWERELREKWEKEKEKESNENNLLV